VDAEVVKATSVVKTSYFFWVVKNASSIYIAYLSML